MSPGVNVHGTPLREAPPAHFADERLLTRVGSHVGLQIFGVKETQGAEVTFEFFLAVIVPEVAPQPLVCFENLSATLAGARERRPPWKMVLVTG